MKWLVDPSELHEIVWSLADLFAAARLERYAALCSSPETHRLLDAWQVSDHEPARRAMRKTVAASGVDPPDSPLLGWGAVMGVVEHSASREVSKALEGALEAGAPVPGARGCKQLATGSAKPA